MRSGDSAHSFLSRPALALDRAAAGELWPLRRKHADPLPVLHVRQMVKRDVASRGADRATVDRYGREVGRPRNGKARTIRLPRWLRDMLAEHLDTARSRRKPPEHTVFHTASGKAVYPTVFMRGVFGPAEAALPAETQGLRFHDLRHPRATLLISAGAHAKRVQERLRHSSITTTLNLYGHVLRCTEAALVHALDAIYEHATQGS